LYPTVSNHIQQLYLLYPAVSYRISPPRKRDIAKNTLQGRAREQIEIEREREREREITDLADA
jgi:hypothetical protein